MRTRNEITPEMAQKIMDNYAQQKYNAFAPLKNALFNTHDEMLADILKGYLGREINVSDIENVLIVEHPQRYPSLEIQKSVYYGEVLLGVIQKTPNLEIFIHSES